MVALQDARFMATNDLCTELQRDVKIDVNMVSGKSGVLVGLGRVPYVHQALFMSLEWVIIVDVWACMGNVEIDDVVRSLVCWTMMTMMILYEEAVS